MPFGPIGLTDSAQLAGETLVEGTVVNEKGAPAAGQVVAFAWPSNEALASMEEGAKFELIPVGRAQTDRSGRFELRLDPMVNLTPALSESGDGDILNIDVMAGDGTRMTTHSTSRIVERVNSKTVVPRSTEVLEDGRREAPERVTLDLGSEASDVHVGVQAATSDVLDRAGWGFGCSAHHQANYNPVWVWVGETLNGPTTRSRFSYTEGASSSLGVGISVKGDYGTFSSSGTHSFSSSATVSFGTTPAGTRRAHTTRFRYGKYRVSCPYLGGVLTNTRTRVNRFDGGHQPVSNPPQIPSSQMECTPYAKGDKFTRTSKSAVTWTDGVKMTTQIGLNLSSKTGFSTTAKLEYFMDEYTVLCGWNNTPPNASRIESFAGGGK